MLNDYGYMSAIEGDVLLQDKITLLRVPDGLSAYEARFPHLPTMEIPGLFGPNRLESSEIDDTAASTDQTPSESTAAPAVETAKPEVVPEPLLKPDSNSKQDGEVLTSASKANADDPTVRSPALQDDMRAHASAVHSTDDADRQDEGGEARPPTGLESFAVQIPHSNSTWSRRGLKVPKLWSQGDKAPRPSSPAKPTKDPKDRRARPGPGVTPRFVSSVSRPSSF